MDDPRSSTTVSENSVRKQSHPGRNASSFANPLVAPFVNGLSQFQQSPTTSNWQSLKRVLHYLEGSAAHGLSFKPGSTLHLAGYFDANRTSSSEDRKSIAGYAVYFGANLVLWLSKKQRVVSRSSAKSEYRALANVAAEIIWLRSLLSELHFPLHSTPIVWCDNLSTIALARNLVFHARTKHVEIDVHYIRDQVLQGKLSVHHVLTHDQVAYYLTKAFSSHPFHCLKAKLEVVLLPLRLRGMQVLTINTNVQDN
ncbi:hypothetical protein Syun_012132 [Stephania yunnanensis]|uniref:Mitochondrial protein n=1 Tax=Stephania yunnanensis TaxID=152371 RepID=A0AAP0PG54_9MAGN